MKTLALAGAALLWMILGFPGPSMKRDDYKSIASKVRR